jgi:hypothetical protein
MWQYVVWPLALAAGKLVIDSILEQTKKPKKRPDGTIRLRKRRIVPVFGKYVTRNTQFQRELKDLQQIASHYASRTSPKRPLNLLLAAEPGSGKSFLVNQLSQSITGERSVQFEEVYVPAFRSIDDIYAIFQRVQSANLKKNLPFVLFDEIGGEVNGQYVLANFLAPMWEGKFHYGRDTHTLGSAIFVFAGSSICPSASVKDVFSRRKKIENITYEELANAWRKKAARTFKKPSKPIPKLLDFVDRMDSILLIPPIDPALLGDAYGEEQTDIACLLVQKHFKTVKELELSALHVLCDKLGQSVSRRLAEKCVFCSRITSTDRFCFADLPAADQRLYKTAAPVERGMRNFLPFSVIEPADRR